MSDILVMRESVQVGDRVRVIELENIYDILIIIEYENSGDEYGVVRYVGEKDTEEHDFYIKKCWSGKGAFAFIYNDSSEIGG